MRPSKIECGYAIIRAFYYTKYKLDASKETEVCLPQSQDQSVDFRENPDSGQAFKAIERGCQIEVWGRNQSVD